MPTRGKINVKLKRSERERQLPINSEIIPKSKSVKPHMRYLAGCHEVAFKEHCVKFLPPSMKSLLEGLTVALKLLQLGRQLGHR